MSGRRGRKRAAWRALAGTGTSAGIGLGLLAVACVFLAVAGPRAGLGLRTRALQRVMAAVPASGQAITESINAVNYAPPGQPVTAAELAGTRRTLARVLASLGLPLGPHAASWSALASGYWTITRAARSAYITTIPPQLQLMYRDGLRSYARLSAGRWPSGAAVTGPGSTVEVAVTQATAARFRLRPGSQLEIRPGFTAQVTGVIRPLAPGSAFWTEFADAAAPERFRLSLQSGQEWWQAAAFIGPDGLPVLQARTPPAALQPAWVFPMGLGSVTADQAPALVQQLSRASSGAAALVGDRVSLSFSNGLTGSLAAFIAADQAAAAILALLFVSLAVLSVVVLLLAARLLTVQRAGDYALMRARGAARWQVGAVALRSGAAAVLPAAAGSAALAAAATPGPGDVLGWRLAALVVLAAVGGPAVMAARQGGPVRRRQRADSAALRRLAAARRWVADGGLIGLAAAGLIVLRSQGISGAAGPDAFTSAAPVLAAVPAAVLAVRLGPLAVRWLARLASRGRGVVPFVGLARAARGQAAGLPVFALVLALAVVAFGGMVRSAVTAGDVAASWRQAGAQAVVGSAAGGTSLTAAAQRAIAAVPGARPVAAVRVQAGATAGGASLSVVIVNPRQYAAVLAGTPDPPFPAAALAMRAGRTGPVPALVSPGTAALVGRGAVPITVGIRSLIIQVAGEVAGTPAASGPVVMLPLSGAGTGMLPPTTMLVGGSRVNHAALAAAVRRTSPGTPVTFRSDIQAALAEAPVPRAAYVMFAGGTAAAAGLSALVLIVALLLGARTRQLTLARLATMGLHPAQARGLSVVEILPSVVAAAAGGIACSLALVPLVGPVIDLSVFTGSAQSVALHPDVAALAGAAAGLLLIAAAILSAQALAAGHGGLRRTVRTGE